VRRRVKEVETKVQEHPPTYPPPDINSDSDSDDTISPVHVKRRPPRKFKRANINYSGKQTSYAGIFGEQDSHTLQKANVFLTTTDLYSPDSKSSSTTRTIDARSYINQDNIIEDTHPCTFVSKLQV